MLNAQMLSSPIQLMKFQLHSGPSLVWPKRDLVLPDRWGKCARNLLRIKWISLELVLRGMEQNCAHNPKEVSSLHPELVLRQVPGESAQWRRQA